VKRAVAKPSAGWGAYPVTQTVVTGRNEDGSAITRSATRMLDISAIDLYPLIDGVLTS
jgi:hypothetical protein